MATRFPVPYTRGSGGDSIISMYREMNRMFEDFFSGGMNPITGRQTGLMAVPTLDIHEKDNELCVSAELPGVKPNEVDVRLEGDTLTISGEKRGENEQRQANYHVMERSYGRFTRSVQLPFTPDPAQVSADFENGVLQVRLKRNLQQESSRRIEVRAGGEQQHQLGQQGGGQPHQAQGSQQGGGAGASMSAGASMPGGGSAGMSAGASGGSSPGSSGGAGAEASGSSPSGTSGGASGSPGASGGPGSSGGQPPRGGAPRKAGEAGSGTP